MPQVIRRTPDDKLRITRANGYYRVVQVGFLETKRMSAGNAQRLFSILEKAKEIA